MNAIAPDADDEPLTRSANVAGKESVRMTIKGSKKFNTFLNLFAQQHGTPDQQIRWKSIDNLRDGDVSEDMMWHFADFVQRNIKCANTARVYFSAVCAALKKLNKAMFQEHSTNMQAKIKQHFVRVSYETRTPLEYKHMPMNDFDLQYICRYLFEMGQYEAGGLLPLDYANLGRMSEGPKLDWKDLIGIIENNESGFIACFSVQWFSGKTHTLTDTHQVLSANNWLTGSANKYFPSCAKLHRVQIASRTCKPVQGRTGGSSSLLAFSRSCSNSSIFSFNSLFSFSKSSISVCIFSSFFCIAAIVLGLVAPAILIDDVESCAFIKAIRLQPCLFFLW